VRIAVLIKQVPKFEAMALGPDGRLQRDGLELEMNPYCRRAVSKGVELAATTGGSCTVLTLGPPAAEDSLREAVAGGADDAVLITDVRFAGSDTLATARALAAALRREGPFDLILAGRNSVDADTGQVGPQVAELLGLPMLSGGKRLDLDGRLVRAHLEYDDGWAEAEVELPALLTCAERLCDPTKVDPGGRAAVPAERIRRVGASELGPGPWGQAGSPTAVGQVRVLEVERDRLMLSGSIDEQVAEAVRVLADSGALARTDDSDADDAPAVAEGWTRGGPVVAVVLEPDRARVARELLGAAARLASARRGRVVALAPVGGVSEREAATWGADELVLLDGSTVEEDLAHAVAGWCQEMGPWAVLAPGTMWGREITSRLSARLGVGLTGDAVDVAIDGGRLIGWKPAFGGRLVAAITSSSAVQVVTVRPGLLPVGAPRPPAPIPSARRVVPGTSRVRLTGAGRDDDIDELALAQAVVGVGAGVSPDDYARLDGLLEVLGAQLGATRKVTDKGWLPRARQIGITGRSLAPRLYVGLGVSGKFNHMVGVRGAGKILAVNPDPAAPVFEWSDVGIVGPWQEVVPVLVHALARRSAVVAER